MASINKLSIRGVRSFSPEDEEQVLEFFFPITIIVGANGCGKTTIIESLKYAITGGLPPGARSGQSFVHDARSIGQTSVKASVKLRFTSKADKSMVVVRSMELTQKKTTASFKQLDGIIRTMDPTTGERVALSHKCTELDKQVPQFMGVSKAILDYVLFCHQEDSSWPLMEGAVLKKRFDEIFDSSRYTKAVDSMRKKEKLYVSQAKDIKADLAGLSSHKHAAQGFQQELENAQEAIEQLDEQKVELAKQMKSTEQDLKKYTDILESMQDVEGQIDEKKNDLHQQEVVVQKQRNMLEQDMTDKPLEKLQEEYNDFDENMQVRIDELEQLEARYQELQADIQKLQDKEKSLAHQATKLDVEKSAHEKRLGDRYKLMEKIAQTHQLEIDITQTQGDQSFIASVNMMSHKGLSQDSVVSISAEDLASFLDALEKKETELADMVASQKNQNQALEKEYFKALGNLQRDKDAIERDIQRISEEKQQHQAELNELSELAKKPGVSRLRKSDVEESRKRADECARQRDEANKDTRRAEISLLIREAEDDIDRLKREIEEDRLALEILRSTSDAQNSLALLKDQCTKDMTALEESVRDSASTLQAFNVSLPTDAFDEDDESGELLQGKMQRLLDSIQTKHEDANSDYTRAQDEVARTHQIASEKTALLASSQQSVTTIKTKLEGFSDSVEQVRKITQELRRYEASVGITTKLSDDSPKGLLAYIEDRLASLEEDAPVENASGMVKKILKKLKKLGKVKDRNVPGGIRLECPCCKRDFEDGDIEAVQLFQDTLNQLSSEGSPLLEVDLNHVEKKANYSNWKSVLNENMEDVRDFNRLSSELRDADKQNQKLVDDVSHYQGKLKEQKFDLADMKQADDDLRDLLEAAKRWMDDTSRIAEKKSQIQHQQEQLSASLAESSRDLQTVERELRQKSDTKDERANTINSLNRETTTLNKQVASLSDQASRLEALAREKEDSFEKQQRNTVRRTELNESMKGLVKQEKKLHDRLVPVKKKLTAKQAERNRLQQQGDEELEKCRGALVTLQSDVKELNAKTDEINRYELSSSNDEMDRVQQGVDRVKNSIKGKKDECVGMQPELDAAKRTVSDQERHRKQIKDNMDIVQGNIRIKELESEIDDLQEQLDAIAESDVAMDKYEEIKKVAESQQESKHRTEGRFSEVVEQIRSLKRKLSAREYKNVEEEYRKTMIKHETTLMAAQDMKKYYTAVDKALLMFHGIKIKEINKIIQELWLLTYKGRDITSIEIVSGQEQGSRAQKSYNYRVVMTKGSSRMDMRGRCSAGQRVLASIVIRLALAESFGVNCGCIALDEPTVNLDYRNKSGLATALAQIVASRAQQRNFQLVMITHDEEFVRMMKSELSTLTGFSMPDKYFQVRREQGVDGKFFSKIDAVDWDELPM